MNTMTKTPVTETKITIRCKDTKTFRDFKRIAADFERYEDVIKWMSQNYQTFSKISPPFYPARGGVL